MKKFTSAFRFVLPALLLVGMLFTNVSPAFASTTASLVPTGNGNYSGWTTAGTGIVNGDCGTNYIHSNVANQRSSFIINLVSIPNGSTITSVAVTASDRANSRTGGVYRTFVRLNGVNIDASSNLTTTSTSGCTARTQNITVPSTVKSGTTALEIGVQYINTHQVRIGTLTAIVTYKITPTISVTNSPVTYNGLSQSATVSGSVSGVVSNVLYDGSSTVPASIGTYAVTADFIPTDTANYNSLIGASAGNFVISVPAGSHAVTYRAGANGTLNYVGDSINVQIVPNGTDGSMVIAVPNTNAYQVDGNWFQGRGYHFTGWSDGRTDDPRIDTGVAGNIDVTANFAVNTITITASAGTGGSISSPGVTVVEAHNTQTYNITPDEGYHILNVRVDDNDAYNYGAVSSYTFPVERTHHNHFIVATFEADPVPSPANSGAGNGGDKIKLPEASALRAVLSR